MTDTESRPGEGTPDEKGRGALSDPITLLFLVATVILGVPFALLAWMGRDLDQLVQAFIWLVVVPPFPAAVWVLLGVAAMFRFARRLRDAREPSSG